MVAEAQRNVIISLKLAADPKNQAIAGQVARQAEKVSAVSAGAARESGLIINQVEIHITSIHKKESNKRCNQDTKEQQKREKSARKLTKKIQKAEKLRTESQKKAIASGLAAVQGMADMVEGAAKLGLVSEENFEKFSKVHGVIQDGISVFKGAIEMWQAGRETLIALSTATKAQTAANNLLAISNTRTASTGSVNGTAGKRAGVAGQVALEVGSEVVGNTLSGGTPKGTVLGGAKVFGGLALGVAKVGAVALVATEAIQGVRRAFGDTRESSESIVGALWSWREASKQAEESTKKLIKAQKRRQNLLDARKRFEAQEVIRSKLQRDLRTTDTRVNEAKSMIGGETSIQTADRKRLDALREVRAVEEAILEDRKTQEKRIAAGHFRSDETTLQLRKAMEAAQGRLLDAEINRLAVIRDQNKVVKDQLAAAKDKLNAEKESVADKNAQFGKLSQYAQERALEISGRKKAGEQLSVRDIRFLERNRLAGSFTEQFRSQQGAAAGGNQFQQEFGGLDNLNNAQNKVVGLSKQLQAGQGQEALAKQQIEPTALLLKQSTEQRVQLEAQIKGVIDEMKGFQGPNGVAAKAIEQAAAVSADNITKQAMTVVGSIKTMEAATLHGYNEIQKAINNIKLNDQAYGT